MKLYRNVFIMLMLLMAFLLFTSCDNTVSVKADNYEVSIIEPDFSLNPDSVTGEKNVSVSVEGVEFMIKMNPAWKNDDKSSVYGDTGGNYIEVNDINSIGYFAQGLWNYSVKAYYNQKEIYTYSGQVEINKYSRTITIDPSSLVVSDNSGSRCTVKLSSFDILLVESLDKYNQEVEGGFRYTVGIKSLENGNSIVDENLISKQYLSSTDGVVASIASNGFEVGSVPNGAYEISILMYEWAWSDIHNKMEWIKTGGTSSSFVGIPGAPITISGILYPSDYVEAGKKDEGGINIDSGKNAKVTITPSVEGAVDAETEVVFTGKLNGNETSGQWFVNDKPKGSDSTFTYKPTGMAGKTVTITYIVLDQKYNNISENYYLTVNAATTTP